MAQKIKIFLYSIGFIFSIIAAQNVLAANWVATGNDIYYNAGKVSIGQATPFTDLDIKSVNNPYTILGNKTSYSLFLHDDSATNGLGIGIGLGISSGNDSVGSSIVFKRTGSNSQGELQFYTKGVSAAGLDPTLRMIISDTGSVAIGTSTASTDKLYVNGDTKIKGNLIVTGTINGQTNISGGGGSAATSSNKYLGLNPGGEYWYAYLEIFLSIWFAGLLFIIFLLVFSVSVGLARNIFNP
jgi:hypothetical protein